MAVALERAIDALSNPDVELPDALRTLLVVSRRIGADDLTAWLRSELDGYSADAVVPDYRRGDGAPIELRFDGPWGSSTVHRLTPNELPAALGGALRSIAMRQPAAELMELSRGDADPKLQLPIRWIGLYRKLAEERKVFYVPMLELNHAALLFPRTHLKGSLDRVKTTALDLALSLDHISSDAGSTEGPTVADEPRLAQEIHFHLTQLYAEGATITVGDRAAVATGSRAIAVQLESGDTVGLLAAVERIAGTEASTDLEQALKDDGGKPGERTRGFLAKLKAGGYTLASGFTTNAAYDGVVHLVSQVFAG